MKAVFYRRFGDRSVLEFGDQPEPAPKTGELLIDVHRTSVNFVDIRERQGTYNKPETHGGHVALPHIPGLQATGVVAAAGADSDLGWVVRKCWPIRQPVAVMQSWWSRELSFAFRFPRYQTKMCLPLFPIKASPFTLCLLHPHS